MNSKRLAQSGKLERKYQEEPENKIEVVGCPNNGNACKSQLAEINKHYYDSTLYKKEKNYLKAIHLLKNAWQKTYDLQQSSCAKCADLFRETINSSMENIHNDLQQMTTGIFRNKRYQEVYLEASRALKEFGRSQ